MGNGTRGMPAVCRAAAEYAASEGCFSFWLLFLSWSASLAVLIMIFLELCVFAHSMLAICLAVSVSNESEEFFPPSLPLNLK